MRDYLPTFSDNRDRLVYLIAEYKIPLSILALAATIGLVVWTPQIPSINPAYLWFAVGFVLLLGPSTYFGIRIASWLWEPDLLHVVVCDDDPDGTEYQALKVPAPMWENATVTGATPLSPDNGNIDFIVTRWNYYEDIGEIEVRGCERSDLTPGEALETKERVDQYYESHHILKRKYSRLKATLQGKISEVHDLTIMRMMEEREEAELAVDKSVTGIIEDMERAVEDLPDGPSPDQRNYSEKWLDDDLGELRDEHLDLDAQESSISMNDGSNVEAAADGGRDL